MKCREKTRFNTLAAAEHVGRLYGLAAYHCPECSRFHVTGKAQSNDPDELERARRARESKALREQTERDRKHMVRRKRAGKSRR